MEYPVPTAIAAHLVSGLRDANARVEEIEAKVTAEVAKLPASRRGALTTDAIFANAALAIPSSSDLRTMTSNPAFKIEPSISQLRRAEAAYIEAHDAYLKEASDRHIEEMRWAHARLAIARQLFDGLVAALPPAKRATATAHPTKSASKAVKYLRLAAFSDEEQKALRLAVVDRQAAITQIDRIIMEGRASGKDLRMIHAYLVDPSTADAVMGWLVDAHAVVQPSDGSSGQNSDVVEESVATKLPGRAFNEMPPPLERANNPAIADAVAVLDDWLNRLPALIGKFKKSDGLWRFDDVFKSKIYETAYRLVAAEPGFQRMIEARKAAQTGGSAAA